MSTKKTAKKSTRKVAKKSANKAAKKTVRKVTKTAKKKTAKKAAKKTIKKAAKKAVKKTARKATKATKKKAAKKAVKKKSQKKSSIKNKTDKDKQGFDINELPQDQLVAFYGLPFAAAAVDGKIDTRELMSIYQTLDLEPLDQDHRKAVAAFLVEPPDAGDCLSILNEGCDELRFATVVAVAEVITADDVITDEEEALLEDICKQLRVEEKQKKAILHFAREARRIETEELSDGAAGKVMKDAAGGLAAVGVPIAAVYFSGSVIGLSAAGLTSGLAALGLGFGMVPGIGIAVALGIGIFSVARSLMSKRKKSLDAKHRAKHERKAQLVIKNLQAAIVGLIDRINQLEHDASTAEANEEAIRRLTERLSTLKELLEIKKEKVA